MTILTKYLTREIIRHFCVVLGVVIIIFLAVDFFENIDDFLDASVPALAFWYFLFKIPQTVSYMFPIALLLAILITFGLMNKHNELIALKSSGVSIFHLFKPVAALGVLGAVLLFLLSDIVVPAAMTRANRILLQEVKGEEAALIENIWIKGDHSFFKIGQYDPEGQVIYGLTAYYLDDQSRFSRRMDANRGEYKEGRWVLQDLLVQKFDPGTEAPKVSFSSHKAVNIELQPEQLLEIAPETDEMSCKTLQAVIDKMEAEGDDANRYRVDLQNKVAFPVVCLLMCLIGTAIAVRGKLKGGLPAIVSYGIGIAFLYYIVWSICISFGYGGILPPVAAAWAPHVIFLCVGGVALISAQS